MESSSSLADEDDALLNDASNLGYSMCRAKPSCSSPSDRSNKENVNMNNSETQKLNLEPLQMKRKRKGAGYNLRKSLAWDRAFFTEEGVLDPLELSMITGTHSGVEGLSVISEEGNNLITGDCQFSTNSPNCKSHQRKKGSHKSSTSHGGCGTGLKSGCPRPSPSPSSSLKRPGNLYAGRSATKESKFPKTAIRKPGTCAVPVTAKGTVPSGGSLKRKEIVQPAVKIQRSAGSMISTNVNNIPKVKAGSVVRSSAKLSKVNSDTSPVKIPSSTNTCSSLVSKVDKTHPKVIPNDVVPAGMLCATEDRCAAVIASARQHTSTAISSMNRGQMQSRKPSGLRMPSPSLGYFGQAQTSVSSNLAPRSSESITPALCKFGYLRRSQAHGEKPKTLDDIMASLNTRCLSSRRACSETSDFNAVSHNISKPAALEKKTKKLVVKSLHDTEHAEVTSDEPATLRFHDFSRKSEDHNRDGKIVPKQDSHHQTNVIGLLQQTEVCEHLMEADDIKKKFDSSRRSKDSNTSDLADSPLMFHKTFALGDSLVRENLCHSAVSNPDTVCELKSGVKDSGRKQNSLTIQCHKEMAMPSFYPSSSNQFDGANFSTCESTSLPDGDKTFLKTKHNNTSKLIEEAQFNESAITGSVEAESSKSCDSELENSLISSPEKRTNCFIEAVSRDEIKNAHLEEGQSHAANGILTTGYNKNYLNPQAEADDLNEQSERHFEAEAKFSSRQPSQSACLAVEKSSCRDYDHMLLEKQSHNVKVIEILPPIVPDGGHRLCQAPGELQADGLDTDRQILRDVPLPDFVETAPLVEDSGCLQNMIFKCDVSLSGKPTPLDFDSSSSEQLEFVDADTQDLLGYKEVQNMNIDGLCSDAEGLRSQNLSDCHHNESQTIDLDGSIFFPRKRVLDESQNSELPNASSKVQDYSAAELHSSISIPHSVIMVPDNPEHRGDVVVRSIVGNRQADSLIRHTSLVQDHKISEEQECDSPHLQAPKDSKGTDRLHVQDHLLNGKCSISGQSTENDISGCCEDALPQKADVYKCELGGRSDVVRVLRSLDETDTFNCDSLVEDRPSDIVCAEDAQSESVTIAPSPETHELLTDIQIERDVQLGMVAKSLEFSSDLMTAKDNENTSCVEHSSLGDAICLSTGENSLESEQDLDGLKKNTLAYENKSEVLHEIDNSAGELHDELNNASCSTTDKDTIGPTKNSEKGLDKNNMRIILPRDVAPFSEEWLAAIEAAGEDILTLKSGAVQNSPPDKSQPEPSPWSPVRRRNNEIGPYDCTKFTNPTPPSD